MTNSITNRQMVSIIFVVTVSSLVIVLPKIMVEAAGTGAWFTLILTSVLLGIGTLFLTSLNNRFQGRMLIEYSGRILGKPASYILAAFYIPYFFSVMVSLCFTFYSTNRVDFLPRTPLWGQMLFSLPIYGFIAYKGITNVARLAEVIGILLLVTAVTIHVTMLFEGKPERILPLYDPKEAGKYFSAARSAIVPLLGFEVLAVIPFTASNGKRSKWAAFFTMAGIGLFFVLVVESSVMMVGIKEITRYEAPLDTAIRTTQFSPIEFMQRMDFMYHVVGSLAAFTGSSIVYMVIVETVCRMWKRSKRWLVVVLVGVITGALCIISFGNEESDIFLSGILTYAGLSAAIFIPMVLLLIAKVRKIDAKNY